MFRFIGKSIVLGAVSLGALGFLYGKDQVLAWCKQGKQKIQAEISELQGMTSELDKIQGRVGSLEEEMRRLKESSIREEIEVQHLEKETTDRQGALEHLRQNLEKAQSLLASDAVRFRIGGIEYGRAEIERDVADKIELFKVQQETLEQLKATYETHRGALALAKENVIRGEALKSELAGKVRLMQAKLEKHRAREIYAEAVASDFDAQDFNTEIGEVRQLFAKFETKLEVKNRMLDERMKVAQGSHVSGIDYAAPERAAPNDVVGKLNDLLNPKVALPSKVVIVSDR